MTCETVEGLIEYVEDELGYTMKEIKQSKYWNGLFEKCKKAIGEGKTIMFGKLDSENYGNGTEPCGATLHNIGMSRVQFEDGVELLDED